MYWRRSRSATRSWPRSAPPHESGRSRSTPPSIARRSSKHCCRNAGSDRMWGIVPAAGSGTRIQPLAFSKELLPVGSRFDGATERPRAVSEYLLERMLLAGADKICFVISPWKSDIVQYYGGTIGAAAIAYVVQPEPAGLCDAIFRAVLLIHPDESVLVGLPDTIWLPQDALGRLPDDRLAFLTFPVDRPELFDAVVSDRQGRVREIQVK